MRKGPIILLLFAFLIVGVSALTEDIRIEDVQTFSVNASLDTSIFQVSVDDLNEGISTIYLDAYGDTYTLEVDLTKSWGWWNFDITMVYPNSSTATKNISILRPFALDYDLKIQYVLSEISWIFDIDIYVDPYPFHADTFFPAFYSRTWILFNHVSGTLANTADVTVRHGTEEEINKVVSGDVIATFVDSLGGIASVTWSAISAAIRMIPGVGEYFADLIDITGAVLYELWWYFDFFIFQEPEITFLIIETFILAHVITSGKSFMGMLRLIYKDHIKLIHGVIDFVKVMYDLITGIIHVVAAIIQAIKPI